jgi:uncharacterized protein YkwD
MDSRTPIASLNRRSLMAGAFLFAGATHAAAAPTSNWVSSQKSEAPAAETTPPASRKWVDYNARLRARLGDAGGGMFDADFAHALLPLVNGLRDQAQLAPYDWDEGLAACARAHAADLASRNYFAHETPEGFTHLDRVALLTRDFCGRTAENLAWRDYPSGTTPQDIELLWENSPGHRNNLLRDGFASAGYGVVKVANSYYAAGVYAHASVRLARALPLWVAAEHELRGALADASPTIERLSLTAPFQQSNWLPVPTNKIPTLQSGAWQLRPLQMTGDGRYSVLSGPLFFVG